MTSNVACFKQILIIKLPNVHKILKDRHHHHHHQHHRFPLNIIQTPGRFSVLNDRDERIRGVYTYRETSILLRTINVNAVNPLTNEGTLKLYVRINLGLAENCFNGLFILLSSTSSLIINNQYKLNSYCK